nr:hypothetical protein [Desulfobulbaceae bacterium]
MKKKLAQLCLFLVASMLTAPLSGFADTQVDSEVLLTMKPSGRIIDTAMSNDGKLFFVLNDSGKIEIFEAGMPKGVLNVSSGVHSIQSNANGDLLFLSDPEAGTIEIAAVQYIVDIDTADSPFKGAPNAPVEVALFSDFQ